MLLLLLLLQFDYLKLYVVNRILYSQVAHKKYKYMTHCENCICLISMDYYYNKINTIDDEMLIIVMNSFEICVFINF